jgi:hypothetical protein
MTGKEKEVTVSIVSIDMCTSSTLKKVQKDDDDQYDTKNNWLKGLRHYWKKSPEEAKYSDWSLYIKRELDNKTIMITTEAEVDKEGIEAAAGVALQRDDELPEDMTGGKETSPTVSSTTEIVTTYLVHRCVLDLHSGYFKSILGKAFKESNNKGNMIELPTPVVILHQFELLLDYCYTGNLTLDLRNVVAMIYFGDYLQIKILYMVLNHICIERGTISLLSGCEKTTNGRSTKSHRAYLCSTALCHGGE